MLSPANAVQSLSTEKKKELASLIVSGIAGQNLRGLDEELQIQADFIPTKGTVTYKLGKYCDNFESISSIIAIWSIERFQFILY